MKRVFSFVLVAVFSFPLWLQNIPVSAEVTNPQPAASSEPAVNQLNVLVDHQFVTGSLGNYEIMKQVNLGQQRLLTVTVPNGQNLSGLIADFKKVPGVVYVEEDHQFKQDFIPNDPYFSKQWFFSDMGIPSAWNETEGSGNIKVAVIDSEVDITHPDLKNQIVDPFDIITNSSSFSSPQLHGTHVAGIIAAEANNGIGVSGIAPHVKIMPINVFQGDLADSSDIIAGINYAIDHHANIINLSLGEYQYSYLLNAAIQNAYQKGILIISAAGNDGTNQPSYPAAFNNVISVGSLDNQNHLSSFSNYGSDIALTAPGERILSTFPENSYGSLSGTSMASPMVAGVAALVLSKDPNLTPQQVKNILYSSADDLGTPGKDIYYGYGLVDAKKALAATPKGEWKYSNNQWYFYENGIMRKNTWIDNTGNWYYLNSSGVMQTGWLLYNGRWFYLNKTGEMKTGWVLQNNHWYYLEPGTGEMQTGWVFVSGNWYYMDKSGIMATGWKQISSNWYYFYPNGTMAVNTTIGTYKVGRNGAWIH